MHRLALAAIVTTLPLLLGAPSFAQSRPGVEVVDAFIRAEAEKHSPRKQVEAPSNTEQSTTVVERSSASDFLGVALHLADVGVQTGDQDARANAATATISGYTLYSALRASSPVDQAFYSQDGSRLFRDVSLTLGYEDPDDGAENVDTGRTTIIGGKVRLYADASEPSRIKRAPAQLLATPASSVFLPTRSALELRGSGDESCNHARLEAEAVIAGRKSGRELTLDHRPDECDDGKGVPSPADVAVAAPDDSRRWGMRVCRREKLPQTFFREGSRLQYTYGRLEYVAQVLCEEAAGGRRFARTVADGPPAGLLAALARGPGAPAAGYADGTAEVGFERLVEAAQRSARQKNADERFGFSFLSSEVTVQPRPGDEQAYEALREVEGEWLTPYGRAVRAWALGDREAAFAAFAEHLEQQAEERPAAERDRTSQLAGLLVYELNKRTEVTLAVNSKVRSDEEDDLQAFLVLEAAPIKRFDALRYLNITANAGFEYVLNDELTRDVGGLAALELELPLRVPDINRRIPRIALSGRGRWLKDRGDQYIGQLKLKLPLAEGFEIPLSVSVANRTDLIDETEVRGLLGFTIDTTRIAGALSQGLAPVLTAGGS